MDVHLAAQETYILLIPTDDKLLREFGIITNQPGLN